MSAKLEGLALLRAPFEAHHISKLPKGTKAQNMCQDSEKTNCTVCGGWHHPRVRHLDYVGHAAITDRLLDCDEAWFWEPLAFGPDGLPAIDADGGLWIRLTVCGVSRLGYGNAKHRSPDASSPGDRLKEVVGDAIRNAAMRFGAALELWHKGELHPSAGDDEEEDGPDIAADWISAIEAAIDVDDLRVIRAHVEEANLTGPARTKVTAAWNARKKALAA